VLLAVRGWYTYNVAFNQYGRSLVVVRVPLNPQFMKVVGGGAGPFAPTSPQVQAFPGFAKEPKARRDSRLGKAKAEAKAAAKLKKELHGKKDAGEADLMAMIQARQASRGNSFAQLEAKYLKKGSPPYVSRDGLGSVSVVSVRVQVRVCMARLELPSVLLVCTCAGALEGCFAANTCKRNGGL
jgi:hypothetical protein